MNLSSFGMDTVTLAGPLEASVNSDDFRAPEAE